MATQKQKIARYRNFTKRRLLGARTFFFKEWKSLNVSKEESKAFIKMHWIIEEMLKDWDENTKEETNI